MADLAVVELAVPFPKSVVPISSTHSSISDYQLKEHASSAAPIIEPTSVPGFSPGWRFYAIFGSLCIITLVVALDATTISVALPIISQALHGSAIEAFWSGTSFLLACTVFQPTFAAFSYSFGRKPMILFALMLFTIGAIVAAISENFTVLLGGRSIQGVGAGGMISLTEVVVTDLIPLRERGKWFGFLSITWAVGSVSGPLIGGSFAGSVSWRWIFWINLPFCGLGFVTIPLFLRLKKPQGELYDKLVSVDWVGAALLPASVTSFLIPLSWGGVMYSWSSWRTLVPLMLGVFGLIGFIVFESSIPHQPLVRMEIFKSRTALANYFGITVHGMLLWCLLYYLPLYYEAVKDYSPLISGVAVLPETFTVAPTALVAGILISISGRFRWAVWTGWSITVLGMGLLYLLSPTTSIPAWISLNLLPGLGIGLLFPGMEFAVQAAAGQNDVAYAAAMYNFMRAFGQSIGVALGGAVFQSQFKRELARYPELSGKASQLSQDASSLVQLIKAMAKDQPERAMIVHAYADSLKVLWAVMAGLAFVALVVSSLTKGLSLDEELVTDQGLRED
ncbi:MFS general substrate transporter [Glonium stellatum]|uniref:MFS general substrate transporter n=1 Tax=Glonium stellatum TaxID=574774 RepID=A0A8E2F361_9PEZI|nr:MFS general substrate transporter [Glonium stellatum]